MREEEEERDGEEGGGVIDEGGGESGEAGPTVSWGVSWRRWREGRLRRRIGGGEGELGPGRRRRPGGEWVRVGSLGEDGGLVELGGDGVEEGLSTFLRVPAVADGGPGEEGSWWRRRRTAEGRWGTDWAGEEEEEVEGPVGSEAWGSGKETAEGDDIAGSAMTQEAE